MDYSQSPDDELVRLIGEGDTRGLEGLYDRHSRAVYSLALRMLGDPAQAEDVTQDVFLRVWRQPDRYDPARGEFATWILGITHHRVIDLLRSRRFRAAVADKLRTYAIVEARTEREAVDAAFIEQRRLAVQAALTGLSPAHRELVELAFYSGLTHTEIADRTQIPLGTVKTRIRRAIQQLRVALDAVGVGAE